MDSESLIPILVILLRVFIPFSILRFPLLGGFLAMFADAIDVMIFEAFGVGFFKEFPYHHADKIFDMWYLFFEFLVVLRWKDILAKNAGKVLFGWRALGFIAFMLTGIRYSFFLAPNIFEFYFLTYLIIKKFNKKFKMTWKKLTIILLAVGIPNIIKEYIMHFKYIDQTWHFFRDNIFWWLYK